jgi:hypothetical protein
MIGWFRSSLWSASAVPVAQLLCWHQISPDASAAFVVAGTFLPGASD